MDPASSTTVPRMSKSRVSTSSSVIIRSSSHQPPAAMIPEQEMLCDWLDWHRDTPLRKCAGLNAVQLATRAVPSSRLSLLGPARAQEDYDIYLAECRAIDAALKGATLDDTYTFRGQACEPSPGRQLPTEPSHQECPFAATV